jgi:hypothetical protein
MTHIPGGYVMLARKILESDLMDKPPLWGKLWMWMLCRARKKPNGKYQQGEFLTSIEEMREAMSWRVGYRKVKPSKAEIRKAYEGFAKSTMVSTTKSTRGMVVRVLNFMEYQDPKNYEGHNEGHNESLRRAREGTHDTQEEKKNKKKEKKERPPAIDFEFETGSWRNVTTRDRDLWAKAYPAVDLDSQLARAAAWLSSNPDKKKSDYKRFLNNWLNRAQDKGGDIPANQRPLTQADIQAQRRAKIARELMEDGQHETYREDLQRLDPALRSQGG